MPKNELTRVTMTIPLRMAMDLMNPLPNLNSIRITASVPNPSARLRPEP